jgi:hypothetical protein
MWRRQHKSPPNSAALGGSTDCQLAVAQKLRNCDCGPSKFDFRNSATLSSFLPDPLLSIPFPQLRMVLKITTNIFRVSVSLETENLPYRDRSTIFFTFFSWIDRIPDSTP